MALMIWIGSSFALVVASIGACALALHLRRRRLRQRLVPRYAGSAGPDTLSDLSFESFVRPEPSAPLRLDATLPPTLIRNYRRSALQQVPSGFDVDAFVTSAKRSFMQWRAAWQQGDQTRLQLFTASELFERVRAQLDLRSSSQAEPSAIDSAEVVALEAELLALHNESPMPVASVRFKGILEALGDGSRQAFDEVWNLAEVVGEASWVVSHVESVRSAA
ncbi:hypothetical protein BH09PSE6_BH09PSE6_12250 [soil metagenome]